MDNIFIAKIMQKTGLPVTLIITFFPIYFCSTRIISNSNNIAVYQFNESQELFTKLTQQQDARCYKKKAAVVQNY